MRRWFERLLERTELVRHLRDELHLANRELDQQDTKISELTDTLQRHIFVPRGCSSLREAYESVVQEYHEHVVNQCQRMVPNITEHPASASGVRMFSATISPSPRVITFASIDMEPGEIGRQMMARTMTQRLIRDLEQTLPIELEQQLEQQCRK